MTRQEEERLAWELQLEADAKAARRARLKTNGPEPTPPSAKLDPCFTLFDDLETAPRKKWLVKDFIGEGEMNCTFGPPSSGKSCIVGDRGAHIAASRLWFGRRVECSAVLHVAAERAALVKRRYAAFGKFHGISSCRLRW
jgi:AAA domain